MGVAAGYGRGSAMPGAIELILQAARRYGFPQRTPDLRNHLVAAWRVRAGVLMERSMSPSVPR